MAISYPETTAKWASNRNSGHARLAGALVRFFTGVVRWTARSDRRPACIVLDGMSQEQLCDIGIRRVGHLVPWHDCRIPGRFEEYDYRYPIDDSMRRG